MNFTFIHQGKGLNSCPVEPKISAEQLILRVVRAILASLQQLNLPGNHQFWKQSSGVAGPECNLFLTLFQ